MLITASVLGHKAIKACKKLDKVAHFSEKKKAFLTHAYAARLLILCKLLKCYVSVLY